MRPILSRWRSEAFALGCAVLGAVTALAPSVCAQDSAAGDESAGAQEFVRAVHVSGGICALRADGEAECHIGWFGSFSNVPAFEGSPRLLDLDAGEALDGWGAGGLCGVRTDHTLVCSGEEAGLEAVPEGRFDEVAVGVHFACALGEDRRLSCWGKAVDLFERMVGDDADLAARLDIDRQRWAPRGQYTSVVAEGRWACAIEQGGATMCWRFNRVSERGERVRTTIRFEQVELAANREHTLNACGITADERKIVCWGAGSDYEMEALRAGYVDLAHNGSRVCGVDSKGAVDCSDFDRSDQGAGRDILEPKMREIVMGVNVGCGVGLFDDLYCWRPRGDDLQRLDGDS